MHQSPSVLVFESKSGFLLYILDVDTWALPGFVVDISPADYQTLFHPELKNIVGREVEKYLIKTCCQCHAHAVLTFNLLDVAAPSCPPDLPELRNPAECDFA